jgi:hypothetical protein
VASHAVWECAEIVRDVYTLAGTSAIRKGSVLERLYRDGGILTQHVSSSGVAFETLAKVRYGLEPMSMWV